MVRPEHVHISTTPLDGPNVWQGSVSHTFFLGNAADVYVNIGTLKLRSQLSPPLLLADGQPVWVQIPIDAVRLFARTPT